jgi:hypothetical protein
MQKHCHPLHHPLAAHLRCSAATSPINSRSARLSAIAANWTTIVPHSASCRARSKAHASQRSAPGDASVTGTSQAGSKPVQDFQPGSTGRDASSEPVLHVRPAGTAASDAASGPSAPQETEGNSERPQSTGREAVPDPVSTSAAEAAVDAQTSRRAVAASRQPEAGATADAAPALEASGSLGPAASAAAGPGATSAPAGDASDASPSKKGSREAVAVRQPDCWCAASA